MTDAIIGGGQTIMGEGEIGAAIAEIFQADTDQGVLVAGEGPAPGEGKAARFLDDLEHAFHRHLAARDMHDQVIAATDARLELEDVAIAAFGSDPGAPL